MLHYKPSAAALPSATRLEHANHFSFAVARIHDFGNEAQDHGIPQLLHRQFGISVGILFQIKLSRD